MCVLSSGLTDISGTLFPPKVGRWWWIWSRRYQPWWCASYAPYTARTVSDYRGITEREHSRLRSVHGGDLRCRYPPWPCFKPMPIHKIHFAFSWNDQLYVSSAYYFKQQPFAIVICELPTWKRVYSFRWAVSSIIIVVVSYLFSDIPLTNLHYYCTVLLSSEITSNTESIMVHKNHFKVAWSADALKWWSCLHGVYCKSNIPVTGKIDLIFKISRNFSPYTVFCIIMIIIKTCRRKFGHENHCMHTLECTPYCWKWWKFRFHVVL